MWGAAPATDSRAHPLVDQPRHLDWTDGTTGYKPQYYEDNEPEEMEPDSVITVETEQNPPDEVVAGQANKLLSSTRTTIVMLPIREKWLPQLHDGQMSRYLKRDRCPPFF